MSKRIPAHVREQQISDLPNITFVRWQDGEYRSNKSKALCRCTVDGHEWNASVNQLLTGGTGCPHCAGKRAANVHACKYRKPREKCEQEINDLPSIHFVRWLDGEYANNKSRAVVRCEQDHEWDARVVNLFSGKGCPECAGKRRWTADERIAQINALNGIRFTRWDGVHCGKKSKAVVQCAIDGYEWSASMDSLLNNGSGCPQCAGVRRWTADERVEQINSLTGISFVRWLDGEYRGARSKAVYRCDKGHEWSAGVYSILNNGSGCPQCAEYGYNPSKPGTLYALRSECGTMVKIGISNDYEQRLSTLKRTTPFNWQCVELLHSDDGTHIARLEKEIHNTTEPAITDSQFDGYTEWRKWDTRILKWFNR